jgi:hypothetical protein
MKYYLDGESMDFGFYLITAVKLILAEFRLHQISDDPFNLVTIPNSVVGDLVLALDGAQLQMLCLPIPCCDVRLALPPKILATLGSWSEGISRSYPLQLSPSGRIKAVRESRTTPEIFKVV